MAAIQKNLGVIYGAGVTIICAVLLLTGSAKNRTASFDEITVQRINVTEPDGTVRMVLSSHAKLPGILVHGKEKPFQRPQAGMLFYNDDGSETGGLIFGGHRNSKGEVEDSGGSLSFDKYEANEVVQLAGVDDKEDRFAGLGVRDSISGNEGYQRLWAGRGRDGSAVLELMDAKGRKRIMMQVKPDGSASLAFLDADGRLVNELAPVKSR